MKVQRLRVTFARGDALRYITHLDQMRAWERALRRAGIPIAYSEGFTPHAQIALASPLPVGTTSDAELMDVFLAERMHPREFSERVGAQLPPAMRLVRVEEAGVALPSLQAQVRAAEWEADVAPPPGFDVERAVADFLAADSVPWEHRREDEVKSYDIRALVKTIEVEPRPGAVRLRMLLRSDSGGSGRPEQVAAALGLPAPLRLHRTRVVLASASPARQAWRTRGRFTF